MTGTLLRWFHDRFKCHRWVELAHREDAIIDGEPCHYLLVECSCGAIREGVQRLALLPFLPGLAIGVAREEIRELDRLEDARVWAES